MYTHVLFFTLLPLFLCALTQDMILDYKGLDRKYLIHVPETKPKTPIPLVMVLHGARGGAQEAAKHFGWIEKADEENFIIVFPEAGPRNPNRPTDPVSNPFLWNDANRKDLLSDDIGFLRKVIEDVSAHFPVDSGRVYITGFSRGASMAFTAGIALSDIVAAIAPVSGHLWLKNPRPLHEVSLLLIVGDADPKNPLEGGKLQRKKKPAMIQSVYTWLKILGIPRSDRRIERAYGVTTMRWGPNKEGREAIFIVVSGQGHEWPGGIRRFPPAYSGNMVDFFDATDVIWDFFKTQTR